jgi:dolichyl-diphosphooligosaccharide--protein glycosyltransferase
MALLSQKISDSYLLYPVRLALLVYFCKCAYQIRLHAIEEYGLVIHEFDPWFNYRATEYLDQHGLAKFFKWYDYMSWYPLGRPVGTTIYPGMQMTSVFLKNQLNAWGYTISLNDVCCYVPAWFGVTATLFLGAMAYECTGSSNAALAAAGVMSILPAHLMRSVGGGYDNESVAMTAICMVFFFWVLSLRSDRTWPIGVLTGLAYGYMVAAWGGYIFVINMVALHALFLLATGRFSDKLHRAYSLFYVIGTFLAIQVPVVGWAPLKSMEQIGAFGVFGLLQIWWLTSMVAPYLEAIEKKNAKPPQNLLEKAGYRLKTEPEKPGLEGEELFKLRYQVCGASLLAMAILAQVILPSGFFGPMSSRVRGLFVRHTRTGNPLVDSVAEHQPGSAQSYWQYMHNACYAGLVGYFITLSTRNDQKLFLTCYATVAYYFSMKMVRLVLLMAPITSALAGVAISRGLEWAIDQATESVLGPQPKVIREVKVVQKSRGRGGGKRKEGDVSGIFDDVYNTWMDTYESKGMESVRKGGAAALCILMFMMGNDFVSYSQEISWSMSSPSIMYKASMRDGRTIMVDDYREAYWWLRDNTAPDARVMAWWDYGYQIAGIANRTTIADGNTWNHEHIATLGRCLTSPEKDAHRLVRHLADYVLIWTGGGGDDLAKSPHMARIGTSVYSDICPGDPTCSQFGFTDRQQTPTPMMEASLLFKLHSHNQRAGVKVDPDRFREAFTSKYRPPPSLP